MATKPPKSPHDVHTVQIDRFTKALSPVPAEDPSSTGKLHPLIEMTSEQLFTLGVTNLCERRIASLNGPLPEQYEKIQTLLPSLSSRLFGENTPSERVHDLLNCLKEIDALGSGYLPRALSGLDTVAALGGTHGTVYLQVGTKRFCRDLPAGVSSDVIEKEFLQYFGVMPQDLANAAIALSGETGVPFYDLPRLFSRLNNEFSILEARSSVDKERIAELEAQVKKLTRDDQLVVDSTDPLSNVFFYRGDLGEPGHNDERDWSERSIKNSHRIAYAATFLTVAVAAAAAIHGYVQKNKFEDIIAQAAVTTPAVEPIPTVLVFDDEVVETESASSAEYTFTEGGIAASGYAAAECPQTTEEYRQMRVDSAGTDVRMLQAINTDALTDMDLHDGVIAFYVGDDDQGRTFVDALSDVLGINYSPEAHAALAGSYTFLEGTRYVQIGDRETQLETTIGDEQK